MPYGLKDIELQKLCKVFESNERIERVVLYGSRAKGNYKPFSDVDITLIGEELTHTDLNHLSLVIDDLLLPYQFDISIFHTLKNEALIDHIHRVGITIYERESEWKEYKFSDFVDINPSVKIPKGIPIPFVEMKDLDNSIRYCESSQEKELSGGSRFINGDTLFARITPCLENGKICQVRNLKKGLGFGSTEFHVFRGKEGISDTDFVYYLSRWDEVRDFAEHNLEGSSGRQRVSKEAFDNLYLTLPPLDTQCCIASILTSLDDKIDLLRRENATLEAMAETLFRQWFVVEAKEEWEEIGFGEAIDVYDSRRKPLSKMERDKMKNGNTLYPYYGAAEIMDYVDSYLFDGEYILMGEDGTVKTDDGYPILQYATGKFWPNNHAHVLQAKPPYNNCFVWNYLRTTNIESIVTGAVQPKINQANLLSLPFYKYPIELVSKYIMITRDWWTKKLNNNKQIQILIQTRDGLLPRLMGGEIKI